VWRRRSPRSRPAADDARPLGNEFGWEAHIAVQEWTASVDVKSSIVVVVEAAVAGAASKALISENGEMHHATGLQLATAIAAMSVLVLAVVLAIWVVFPRLKRRHTSQTAPDGLIYFGHLRARRPEDIERALATMTAEEERRQLARQLHVTSDVAWRKHAHLQASLFSFAVGCALLVLAFVAF
jgi:uncharacterized membrane protein YdcZ (DUF606 family)